MFSRKDQSTISQRLLKAGKAATQFLAAVTISSTLMVLIDRDLEHRQVVGSTACSTTETCARQFAAL